MGSRSPRLASSMIVLATIVTTGSLRSTSRNWRTASSSAAASTATVSGPKISCSRSAGFEKGISRYALKHAPAADGQKTEARYEKLKIRGGCSHFDETAGLCALSTDAPAS